MHLPHVASKALPEKRIGGPADYLKIARLDHSTKHIFIVPGIALAYLLQGVHNQNVLVHVVLGLITAICIASANYVINEFLDREFDQFHPTKSARAAVQTELFAKWIFLEWIAFVVVGLTCAYLSSTAMLFTASIFALQGVVYNVQPLRTKDMAYLDVISESINNPLRLMIGWLMIDATTLPPASVILSYWLGGAFLMAAKRLSEYREIVSSRADGKDLLARYRASFIHYTEISLTVSCLLYAMLSAFFLAIFLFKYRLEYITLMPLIVALFGHYLALSMQPGSTAQKPEKLFREKGLIILVLAVSVGFVVTTFVDMPSLGPLSAQRFIGLQ